MKAGAGRCKRVLNKGGIFLNNYGTPKIRAEDLLFLRYLIEKDRLKPVMDRTYSLDEIYEARRYVDTGRKRGNVAVTV